MTVVIMTIGYDQGLSGSEENRKKTRFRLYARSAINRRRREMAAKNKELLARSLEATWSPVTLGELQDFFAICINMGLIKKSIHRLLVGPPCASHLIRGKSDEK